MNEGLSFPELLAYTEGETGRWQQWFNENPAALDLAIDIAGTGTVRRLLLHIFFVELRFANAVLGLPPANFESLPAAGLSDLFAISQETTRKYRQFFATAKPEDWAERVDLGPRLSFKPSKRNLVAQGLIHGIRHWAQLSTFLRQQGFKQDWNHDFLLSDATK